MKKTKNEEISLKKNMLLGLFLAIVIFSLLYALNPGSIVMEKIRFNQKESLCSCYIDDKKSTNGFYVLDNVSKNNGYEYEITVQGVYLTNGTMKIDREQCIQSSIDFFEEHWERSRFNIVKKTFDNGYELQCSYGVVSEIVSKKRGWEQGFFGFGYFQSDTSIHSFNPNECSPVLDTKIVDLNKN